MGIGDIKPFESSGGQDEKGNRECVCLQTYEPMTDEELLNHNNSIMLSIGDSFVSYKESGKSAVFFALLDKGILCNYNYYRW